MESVSSELKGVKCNWTLWKNGGVKNDEIDGQSKLWNSGRNVPRLKSGKSQASIRHHRPSPGVQPLLNPPLCVPLPSRQVPSQKHPSRFEQQGVGLPRSQSPFRTNFGRYCFQVRMGEQMHDLLADEVTM